MRSRCDETRLLAQVAIIMTVVASTGCQDDDSGPAFSPPVQPTVSCGDDLAEADEVCDGTDLAGQDCSTIDSSFVSGALSCLADCSGFDTTGCVEPETFANPFTVDVDGAGTDRLGSVFLSVGRGDVAVAGSTTPALAYETTDWQEFGYTLFHLVVPQADRLHVVYLYCDSDELPWVWHESYDLEMTAEPATGTCLVSPEPAEVEPGLLELTGLPSAAELVAGFTLSGDDVDYQSGPGLLRLEGVDYELHPFQIVDCTGTTCAADPNDGWWELHSMLAHGDRRCFAILYLMVADPNTVTVGYPICFGPAERMTPAVLPASWTAPAIEPGSFEPAAPFRPQPIPGHAQALWPRPPHLEEARHDWHP